MIQNMVIVTFNCFWTVSLLVVFLQLLKVHGQKFNVTNWSKCIQPKDSFVKLVGVSIAECVDACIRRQTCRSIGYRRRMQFCEIHKEDNLVTNANDDSCIFIERNDMDTTNVRMSYTSLPFFKLLFANSTVILKTQKCSNIKIRTIKSKDIKRFKQKRLFEFVLNIPQTILRFKI